MQFKIDPNTLTMIGHIILMMSLIRLSGSALRVHRARNVIEAPIHNVSIGVWILALALCVERIYYAAARGLLSQGIDLYSRHPAPELLSTFAMIGVYTLSISLETLLPGDVLKMIRRRLFELGGLLAAYACTAIMIG
jgi:hypothetical protein